MKASELIAALQVIIDETGDLPVFVHGEFTSPCESPRVNIEGGFPYLPNGTFDDEDEYWPDGEASISL